MAEALDGLLQMLIALTVGPFVVGYATMVPPDGQAATRYAEACTVVVVGEWKNGACVGGDWKNALTLIARPKA
jgi:hypothetical protein